MNFIDKTADSYNTWKNSLPDEWIPRQISREKPISHESRSDECNNSSGGEFFLNRIAKPSLHEQFLCDKYIW